MKKRDRITEDFRFFISKQTKQIQANSVNTVVLNTVFAKKFQQNPDLRTFILFIDRGLKYRNNAFPAGIGKSYNYLRYSCVGFTLSCLPICLVTRFLEPEVGVVSLLDWFESLLDWFVSLLDWFVSLLEWNFVTISVEVLSPSAITCKFLVFQTCRLATPGFDFWAFLFFLPFCQGR
jgi:hypothetical protein